MKYYREFRNCWGSHFARDKIIPMDDEVKLAADQLPPGTTPPLWVDVPGGYSQRDILEKISQLPEMRGLSTTVIHLSIDKDEAAEEFCQEQEWSYRRLDEMAGHEDEAIITMSFLVPESISRPHNLLVMVTSAGYK